MRTQAINIPPANSFREEDFSRVARQVFDMTGIYLAPEKKNMILSRLSKRLKATGQMSVDGYITFLNSSDGMIERDKFVSAYTTNMTRFNREDHHFKHLAQDVLPGLAESARQGARIRIWSAGCSSGEEPYQIAFHVLDICPEAAQLDIKILATDIDQDVLKVARQGVYPHIHAAALPGTQNVDYFDAVSSTADRLRVQQRARDLVTFRQLNLHETWPFKGLFDVVMCRNVAIYFDEDAQSRLWKRFAEYLTPKGMIYIGHSENLGAACANQFRARGNAVFQLNDHHPHNPGTHLHAPVGRLK